METTSIVYLSAEVIVGFMTIVGNCLVLGAIIKSRQLHTVTNVFVGNLAVADIAVGVLVAPCAALSYLGLPHNFYACVFINCLILMFTNVSILMLLFVAIERFIAIKEPFVYQRLLTIKRAFYVNFCVWILGSLLGMVPMYGWHREHHQTVEFCSFTGTISYEYMVYFQFFGLVLLPLFIMLCIYIYILLIVRKHMRQTNALHNQFRQSKDAKEGFNRDVRAAKMFALVILMFGVFWIPVNLFNCVSLFCGLDCYFPIQALLAAIVMSHANSSINPFLYATSNSRIKRGLKELLGFKVSSSDRNVTDYENKRHTLNGKSYARDNSVAPVSSIADYSQDDFAQTHTGSQKALLSNNIISVLPVDQNLQNGKLCPQSSVSETVSDSDTKPNINVNSEVQDSRSHTSQSWLSALVVSEKLSRCERPESQNYNIENSHQTGSRTEILKETNKYSQTPPTTPPSLSDQHHNNVDNRHHQDTQHNNIKIVSPVNDGKHEDSVNKTNCDNDENRNNKTISRNSCNATDRRISDSIHGQQDNTSCWTTSVTPSVINGSVHDLSHQRIVNGERQFVSMNVLQTAKCDMSEELIVNKLNGYISPKRSLSALSCHRNSLTDKLDYLEMAKN